MFKDKVVENKKIVLLIKLLLCLFIIINACQFIVMHDLSDYYSYEDYGCQNEFVTIKPVGNTTEVSQGFIAKGNILTNITIYLDDLSTNNELTFSIEDSLGRTLKSVTIDTSDNYSSHEWNIISMNCDNLERNCEYKLKINSLNGLDSICAVQEGNKPEIFTICTYPNGDIQGGLAVGFQFTYRYLLSGNIFQFGFKIIYILLLIYVLCYTIYRFEHIYQMLTLHTKYAIGYALFFSVSLTLLCNPLDSFHNEVIQFNRVIGSGLVTNVDVSRRISNFSNWFIILATTFFLFFMFANYLLQKINGDNNKKVVNFLNNLVVVANISLVFRCITYFSDSTNTSKVFYYSTSLITILMLVLIMYLTLGLEKYISSELYALLITIAFSAAYPITIFLQKEWLSGKFLLGIQTLLFILILVCAIFASKLWNNSEGIGIARCFSICTSLFPFLLSFYIELINILNQHSIFIASPGRNYAIFTMFSLVLTLVFTLIAYKKKWNLVNWKKWVYPWLIFGISCLSAQLPLESVYNVDIMEGANYSVLISDFLNFRTIPLVEHYGGHMMSEVWEGIIYAILNNDINGAAFSPYAGYVCTLLSVLFFCLIKYVWNEDMALLITLTFPFYNFWSYFGMGMLLCLAVINFIKKNTYSRACLIWLSFIWCILYRLDIGYAFGLASIIALVVYTIVYKRWGLIKQLVLPLLGLGIIGSIIWFVLCFAIGISPIDRIIEFLVISASNVNWGYDSIGNFGNSSFSWCYIFIPFAVVILLTYAICFKSIREKINPEKWLILIIFGLSYLQNFSRGLVRHSLAEGITFIVVWSGYIFLAVFVSCIRDNGKLFLPVFAMLILCDTLLLQGQNFTSTSILDLAANQTESCIKDWTIDIFATEETEVGKKAQTYWSKKAENAEVVKRVKWTTELEQKIKPYKVIMDVLLEKEETFVDFTNTTFVYSAINRKNPVYVSQSPLQLSGEFSQNMFIRQMESVPLVIMPASYTGGGYENRLDGIPNVYRYYKVAEHIYQNYVPLCKYENLFSLWCLPDRYEEMKIKVETLSKGNDYIKQLVSSEEVLINDCEITIESEQVIITSNGHDPNIVGLQEYVQLEDYINSNVVITIDYEVNTEGIMQIYYTTEKEEDFTENKSIAKNISDLGTVQFILPVTEYTRLRLDIPENSATKISAIRVGAPYELIDYGYDGPLLNDNGTVSYTSEFHNYVIHQLPQIWAEKDKYKATSNPVVTELKAGKNIYVFDKYINHKELGNYLLIRADVGEMHNNETDNATIILGEYNNGNFEEKYRYYIELSEGFHEYLIRISTDYYWYIKNINAVCIQTDNVLHNVSMSILEGD